MSKIKVKVLWEVIKNQDSIISSLKSKINVNDITVKVAIAQHHKDKAKMESVKHLITESIEPINVDTHKLILHIHDILCGNVDPY